MSDIDVLFPASYDYSRERFRGDLNVARRFWPEAELGQHSLAGDEEISIDWILAPSVVTQHKLLIVTTGQHGIEGYVGSGMLQLFLDEFLPQINPNDTGLLLVHAINPWGMKHKRRVNHNNVDLNRSFLWASADDDHDQPLYDPAVNPDYDRLERLLNPARPLRKYGWGKFVFGLRFAWSLLTTGPSALRQASLLGQYYHPPVCTHTTPGHAHRLWVTVPDGSRELPSGTQRTHGVGGCL